MNAIWSTLRQFGSSLAVRSLAAALLVSLFAFSAAHVALGASEPQAPSQVPFVTADPNAPDCYMTVKAHKFLDANKNGKQDAGEPSLSGWTFKLYQKVNGAYTLKKSVMTSSSGDADFGTWGAGSYRVDEVAQPNWTNTTPMSVTFDVTADGSKVINYGNIPSTSMDSKRSGSGSAQLGQIITDTLSLTGTVSAGTISGNVQFYLCRNADWHILPDCTTGGTAVGSAVAVASTGTNPPTGRAVSPNFTASQDGAYCFRAEFAPAAGANYDSSKHTNQTTECFTVSTPTAVSIATLSAHETGKLSYLALVAGAVSLLGSLGLWAVRRRM